MSKPVHGDPAKDARLHSIFDDMEMLTETGGLGENLILNADHKTLRRGKYLAQILWPILQFQQESVEAKKDGGRKGAARLAARRSRQ